MPSDSHCGINVSMSIMFVSAKYNTGVTLCWDAIVFIVVIGDGFVLPVANQFSLSTTQKSESSCVAIACVFVTMMSSIISNSMFLLFKYSVIYDFVVSGSFVSKLKSVNVGMVSESVCDSGSMSKSVGNGNVVSEISLLLSVFCVFSDFIFIF